MLSVGFVMPGSRNVFLNLKLSSKKLFPDGFAQTDVSTTFTKYLHFRSLVKLSIFHTPPKPSTIITEFSEITNVIMN